MIAKLASWRLWLMGASLWVGGCGALPSRAPTLAPREVRLAIESSSLVALDSIGPPVAAFGLQPMRTSLSGEGRGAVIAAFIFWDPSSSGLPLGQSRAAPSSMVQTTTLPGGLIVFRRLNVLVIYTRGIGSADLAPTLKRALAAVRAT